MTQSSDIVEGDIVVHEIRASGIEGALGNELEDQGATDITEALLQATGDDRPLNLTVAKTNVGANADEKPL